MADRDDNWHPGGEHVPDDAEVARLRALLTEPTPPMDERTVAVGRRRLEEARAALAASIVAQRARLVEESGPDTYALTGTDSP